VIKQDSFAGHSVKGRGLNHRVAVDTCMWPSPVISDGEQDVGSLNLLLLATLKRAQCKNSSQEK